MMELFWKKNYSLKAVDYLRVWNPWVDTSSLELITDVVILISKIVCSPWRNYEIVQLYDFLKGVTTLLIVK